MNPIVHAVPRAGATTFRFRRIAALAFGEDGGYGPHTLVLTFNAQPGQPAETRLFDMTPYLDRGVFRELRDPAYFRQARLDTTFGTVEWPNGQDLSPDHYYDKSLPLPQRLG